MSEHPESLWLQAYLDGELEPDAAARLEAHCEQCRSCRGELDELRATCALVTAAAPTAGPDPVWPGLVLQQRGRTGPRVSPSFAFASAAVWAAGIALGIVLGSDGSPSGPDSPTPGTSIGSLWSDGQSGSLLNVYLSADSREEGEP